MDRIMDLTSVDESFNAVELDYALIDPKADILKLEDRLDTGDSELMLEDDPENEIDVNEPGLPGEGYVELSPGGILDEETITRGLSNLGRSANGCHQVYLNVTIPGFSLTDISLLSEYQHLQKVEIPYNDITDLSPLGKLKFLLILDASHNKIEKLLDFPLFNLQEVDMSWNNIQEMSDLSAHRLLKKLILDNNAITKIEGLQHCKRLKHLSLSHNKIITITGLDNLPIQYLNLSNNDIGVLENLQSLKYLKEVNLSGNCIRGLSGLSNNTMLESIDLEANEVIDILEVLYLRNAKRLRELSLLRNPIQELPDYRLCILLKLTRLTTLDRHPVKEQEKVSAVNMFNPPVEVLGARDHVMHVVYSFLQPSRVWDSTLPNIGTPYPMLVLVGPLGSGRRELASKLVEEFKDYFGHGISHTTRRPHLEEVADKDYHFVSRETFDADIKRGAFIQTYSYNNNWYGLQMESLESVAREGLACVVNMELEGVLSLKKTYFEPRYVLIVPLNAEVHEKRLREGGIRSENQIRVLLKRSEMYINYNLNHPGFFDMMICSDDITEAYTQLHKLVMDYLGISSTTSLGSTNPDVITDVYETTEPAPALAGRALFNFRRSGTWSKQSFPENMSQHEVPQTGSGIQAQGSVEEESAKRRHNIAKQLVTGYKPPLIERLLTKYPRTAPQTVDSQAGLNETNKQRAHSAPANQSGLGTVPDEEELPTSPDSSSDACSDSFISLLDSASELLRRKEDKVHTNENIMYVLPTQMNGQLLIDKQSHLSVTANLHDAYPPSASHPASKYATARPGSNRHAVLPPISNSAA